MASINDRWYVRDRASGEKVRSLRYGRGKRWQVRYRDPEGESRNRSFDRKVDADRFLVEVSNRLMRGDYVDRRAGRMLFGDYAGPWLERQMLAPTSLASMETRFRVHVLPTWGGTQLLGITPAGVQRWIRDLLETLAPGYVRLIVTNFSAVLSSAVLDGLLVSNPCRSAAVRVPSVPNKRVRPWTVEQVLAVLDAVPQRYRALVAVGAGCALRQGECFGLRVHDVDFLRDEVHVRQQIRIVSGIPTPALPKYARTRAVPMPEWVKHELAAHIARLEPLSGVREQSVGLGGLLFFGRESKPLNRNYFNSHVWRPTLDEVGIGRSRENGMHALRHACASTWLEHGVSIKAVSEYLGHADPGFTLRVYTHVMPSSGQRARAAMDAAFEVGRRPLETAPIAGAHLAHKSTTSGGN